MRTLIIFSLFFCQGAYSQVVPSQGTPRLDRYRGLVYVTKPGGGNGNWQLYKWPNKHWTFIDPDGHAFIGLGWFHADFSNQKALSNSEWGPQQVRRGKSMAATFWDGEGVDYLRPYFQGGGLWPDGWNPETIPTVTYVDNIGASMVPTNNITVIACPTQAAHDFYRALNQTFLSGVYFGGAIPDPWDSCFQTWTTTWFSDSTHGYGSGYQTCCSGYVKTFPPGGVVGPWVIGQKLGESDLMYGMGSASQEPNPGAMAVALSPWQSYSNFFTPNSALFASDRTVQFKQQMMTFMQGRYASIAALNTAWGSSYDTFGTDGTNQTQTVGTGDGATLTFSATLTSVPDVHSVWVKVAGTVVAGDVNDAGNLTTAALNGTSIDSAGSSIVYSTKAITVKFLAGHAPANGAAIVADWYTGGWGHGSGLLDEDGHHSWMPSEWVNLTGTTTAFKADANAFLSSFSSKYYKVNHDAVKNNYSNLLYFGSIITRGGVTVSGGSQVGCDIRPQMLSGMVGNVDAIDLGVSVGANLCSQAQLDAIGSILGDIPIWTHAYIHGNADSSLYQTLGSTTFQPTGDGTFEGGTQNGKGLLYNAYMDGCFNASYTSAASTALAGTFPCVAMTSWSWTDRYSESNWGVVSISDNLYNEAEPLNYGCSFNARPDNVYTPCAPCVDSWGYLCGAEPTAARTGYILGTGNGSQTTFANTIQFLPIQASTLTVNIGNTNTQLDSDSFSQADENPLSSSGKWTTAPGTNALKLVSHSVEAATLNADNAMFRNNITPANDQYSKVTVGVLGGNGRWAAPIVRQSGANANYYSCEENGVPGQNTGTVFLYKTVAGARTRLSFVLNDTITPGDVFELDAQGTTISCFQNGTIIAGLTVTDSSLTSGNVGMVINTDVAANVTITAWSGGNIVANTCTDNGTGIISGSSCASGTVNYKTGAISVTLNSALGSGKNLTAGFTSSGWGQYSKTFVPMVLAEHIKWLSTTEQTFWSPSSYTNLALSKPSVASSFVSGGGLAASWMGFDSRRVVDGDTNTTWQPSGADPQFIRIDMASQPSMGKVILRWGAGFYSAYTIDTSADGITWTNQFTKAGGSGGVETDTFTAVSARYIRMNGTTRSGTPTLQEFEVYAQ